MDAQGWEPNLEQMLAEADRRGIEVDTYSLLYDGRITHTAKVKLQTEKLKVSAEGRGSSLFEALSAAWQSIPPTKDT